MIKRGSEIERHSGDSSKNSEAVAIILMLSLYHFFSFAPLSIISIPRTAIGYLFPMDINNILLGTYLILLCIIEKIRCNLLCAP